VTGVQTCALPISELFDRLDGHLGVSPGMKINREKL
jgi:hypothetical protein